MGTERPKEDEWFAKNEKEMLEKARVERSRSVSEPSSSTS
jgi:hypothetical protein